MTRSQCFIGVLVCVFVCVCVCVCVDARTCRSAICFLVSSSRSVGSATACKHAYGGQKGLVSGLLLPVMQYMLHTLLLS